MEEQEQKQEISLGDINKIKSDLSNLQKELAGLGSKKDALAKSKNEKLKILFEKNKMVASLKKERDSNTSKIKELKKQRDLLNKEFTEGIKKARGTNNDFKKILEKHNIKGGPAGIKREIEALEFKIETEVMSPEKEKQMMKLIKNRKKIYKELTGTGFGKDSELNKELDEKKKQAETTHSQIQELAKHSQEKHEQMIAISKELDPIKKELKAINKDFDIVKMDFSIKNTLLKNKLEELSAKGVQISEIVQKERKAKKEKLESKKRKGFDSKKIKEENIRFRLKSKEREVEEKIKTGKKLTTEDLLVFQK